MTRRLAAVLGFVVLSSFVLAQVSTPVRVRVGEGVMRTLRTKNVEPVYPPLAIQTGVQGTVILQLFLDKAGTVQHVSIYSGHPLLSEAAIAAVKQWQYKPYLLDGEPVGVETMVSLTFKISPDPPGAAIVHDAPGEPLNGGGGVVGVIRPSQGATPNAPLARPSGQVYPVRISERVAESLCIRKVPPQYPSEAKAQHIEGDVRLEVVIDRDGDVYSAEVISGNPVLAKAAVEAVRQWKFKPYLLAEKAADVVTTLSVNFTLAEAAATGVVGSVPGGIAPGQIGSILDTEVLSPPRAGAPQRVRISSAVAEHLLIKKVDPVCPGDARVKGTVSLKVMMDKEGNVINIRLISGHPLVVAAAIDAVRQWKYKPFLLDGVPVEVETQVAVAFNCQGER